MRRYSKATLTAALQRAGLGWQKLRWFNSLLFPVAVAARLVGRLTGKDDSDDSPPPRPLNAAFEAVFGIERHILGRLPMPPGLSIIVLASPKG
jgi:hypothetical protein